MHKQTYKHTLAYCGPSFTSHRVTDYRRRIRVLYVNLVSNWPHVEGHRCVKCPPACVIPTETNARKQCLTYPWLLLLSYAAVMFSGFFLLSCNTWRFVPGATCWELIACHCLFAFVFSSLSSGWWLSKPCFALWCLRFVDDHLLRNGCQGWLLTLSDGYSVKRV